MIRYRFYVGTRVGGTDTVADHGKARAYLLATFGGYTAFDGQGGWVSVGKAYEEPSVVYEVLAEDEEELPTGHASTLARLADQQSVLWTSERVQGGFASA